MEFHLWNLGVLSETLGFIGRTILALLLLRFSVVILLVVILLSHVHSHTSSGEAYTLLHAVVVLKRAILAAALTFVGTRPRT